MKLLFFISLLITLISLFVLLSNLFQNLGSLTESDYGYLTGRAIFTALFGFATYKLKKHAFPNDD